MSSAVAFVLMTTTAAEAAPAGQAPADHAPAGQKAAPAGQAPAGQGQEEVAAAVQPSHSDEGSGNDGKHWHPRRELHFGTADYIVTGAAVGVVLSGALITPSSRQWRGGILFDEDVRDTLRIGSLRGRYFVRDMSDVGVSLASTWPFLVDALVTAWWYRGRADLARDMALVSAEAFAIAAAVQGAANLLGTRERPFGRLCGTEIPEKSVDCEPDVRNRSFFSGHATLAFTSAGLLCANHLGLGLLGKPGDVLTCIGGFTVATATGVFRVMSDMHYATDAVLGALVGTAAGLAVPLLHFRRAAEPTAGKVDVRIGPVGRGIGLVGTF